MESNGKTPDSVRCHRTDGRSWRCNRVALEGLKLCDIHHLQGMHRQYKKKVPESLKIQRNYKGKSDSPDNLIDPKKIKKKKKKNLKEKEKGDLELELLRVVLKREVEKRSKRQPDKIIDGDDQAVTLEKIKSFKRRKSAEGERKEKESKNTVACAENEDKKQIVYNDKRRSFSDEEEEDEELTRDLPNGLMAISPPSLSKLNHLSLLATCSSFGGEGKNGDESNFGSNGSGVRSFRSKNVEPLTNGKLQVVPFKNEILKVMKKKKRRCHACGSRNSLTRCAGCRKELFCHDCIKGRNIEKVGDALPECPVCRGWCSCVACRKNRKKDIESKGGAEEKNKVGRVLHFHYLICLLLPVLKQLMEDREMELEKEAKMEGKKLKEIKIQGSEVSSSKQCCCHVCKNLLSDLHRSCSNCSCNLCLSCCRRIFPGNQKESARRVSLKPACTWACCGEKGRDAPRRKPRNQIIGIPCPSCGDNFLTLTTIFPVSWIKELVASAEEFVGCYDLPEAADAHSYCSICRERKDGAGAHYSQLFFPKSVDICSDNLEHFQKHWGRGQPAVFRVVLGSEQSWDPIVMFCTYLKNNIAKSEGQEVADCMDWFEVEIGSKQLFMGSFNGPSKSNLWHEKLKLRGWLSAKLFREHFPAHYSDVLQALPIPEYMNPTSGVLNVASGNSQESRSSDLGPFVYISYNSGESPGFYEGVTKLRYDSYDGVNILAHASDVPVSTEQLNYVSKLLKKLKQKNSGDDLANGEHVEDLELHEMVKDMRLHNKFTRVSWFAAASHDTDSETVINNKSLRDDRCAGASDSDTATDTDTEVSKFYFNPLKRARTKNLARRSARCCEDNVADSCGALWDVFRRQDIPKIVEYLKKHASDFVHTPGFRGHVVHPILDQNFFLDSMHKTRLKEEFDVEPWTVEQHVGEALIIPAGCPYQIRNLKSCVSMVINFISPENVSECIKLVDELRLLPEDHKAKYDSVEVKRLAVHSISRAVKEIRELTQGDQA